MNTPQALRLKIGIVLLSISTGATFLASCATISDLGQMAGSAVAEEKAKRMDDPAAYQACATAVSACRSSGGLDTPSCKAERANLVKQDIYCAQVGQFSGSRGK